MFVGYGKHPFLIVLRLQTQGIELAIATVPLTIPTHCV